MRIISFAEWLAGAGLTNPRLKVLRQRNQVALAFGRREAYATLDYTEIDAVAALLADDLTLNFDRDVAARLVRLYCAEWAGSVSHADASGRPVYFSIIEYTPVGKPNGSRSHLVGAAHDGNADQLVLTAGLKPETRGMEPRRVIYVNMTTIIARVRGNARRAGYNFSAPFLPPPDDRLLDEILAPYTQARDEALAEYAKKQQQKSPGERDDRPRRAGIVARALLEARVGS
jgi:hypothetical protein